MKKTEAKAHLLDSGKCPVCQGTGWEIFTEKVEGYTEPIEFTRVWQKPYLWQKMRRVAGF